MKIHNNIIFFHRFIEFIGVCYELLVKDASSRVSFKDISSFVSFVISAVAVAAVTVGRAH